MEITRRRLMGAAMAGAIGATAGIWSPGVSAQALADKVVKIVVPLGPGGTADILARLVAADLAAALNNTVIVENKPGGGGVIGALSVARSAPDGLTLCLANGSSHANAPAIQGQPKYDPVEDFTPLGLIAEVKLVLVASPTMQADNFDAFVKAANGRTAPLTYGSPGVGSTGHLMGAQLARLSGVPMTHVPYKSTAEVSRAVMAGEIDFMFDNLPVALPQIRAGRLSLLGVTGEQRDGEFPDTPTLTELGLAPINTPSWFGLVGPAGLPPAVTQELNAALLAALSKPALADKIASIGGAMQPLSTEAFGRYVERAYSSARKAAQENQIVID